MSHFPCSDNLSFIICYQAIFVFVLSLITGIQAENCRNAVATLQHPDRDDGWVSVLCLFFRSSICHSGYNLGMVMNPHYAFQKQHTYWTWGGALFLKVKYPSQTEFQWYFTCRTITVCHHDFHNFEFLENQLALHTPGGKRISAGPWHVYCCFVFIPIIQDEIQQQQKNAFICRKILTTNYVFLNHWDVI